MAVDALAEYAAERRYGYAWNVLDTALYKIAYFAHPQGQLMNELEKAVDDMDNIPPRKILLMWENPIAFPAV